MFSACILHMLDLAAQETVPTPSTKPVDSNSAMKEVAPGIFDLNGVRLDKINQQISFPGVINQREGLVEYLLVGEKGKTHESLIRTIIQPRDIHLALLLIGLKENPKPNQSQPLPPSTIDSAYLKSTPPLKGTPVRVFVSWKLGGKQRQVPAEDWINNLQTGHPMTHGDWTYNGSMIENGVFLADQELSIISVITDPTALINNSRPGHDNDEIWEARTGVIPPLDTPLELMIVLTDFQPKKK